MIHIMNIKLTAWAKPIKKINWFLVFILLLFVPILSFHLLEVPRGLTVDEAAFGYNATLLSRTLHDENHQFLPIFVLSIDGKDWRQPVTQYYQAIYFWIFGASVFNLRFSSIVLTLFTSVLLYFLSQIIFRKRALSLLSVLIYLTVPIVFIQSHLALDNNMAVPFAIIWLIGLLNFQKSKKTFWLVVSAVSLGIGFYTYKGMRTVVPIWSVLSLLYLFKIGSWRDSLKFSLFISPFCLIIPFLESHYPGAVFNGQRFHPMAYYDFIYPYLSYYDPSFLFVTGDATQFHSTGHHGMFLLSTLPLLLFGIYHFLRSKNNYSLVLWSFVTAPLLMGVVNSVHRASRTMILAPLFVIICLAGVEYLWQNHLKYHRLFLFLILILSVLNFSDFFYYYHHDYAKVTENLFGRLDYFDSFSLLKSESISRHLTPVISTDLITSFGQTGKFYEAVNFTLPIIHLDREEDLAPDSIILTNRADIPRLQRIKTSGSFFLHIVSGSN